jgi:FlaA1/EpsC-like NDP-sugar epimerase
MGGTGSLGQALVRRLVRGGQGQPARIIVFSRSEERQYAMKTAWQHARAATDDIYYHNFEELIQFRLADIRDYQSVHDAVAEADVIFNAAAMKHVPTCEYFPAEAAATNITGTDHLVRAVRRTGRAHSLVGVSTDKACKPVNVMGMTKAIQERILVEGNLGQESCRVVMVRYGNVVASRGAAIPLFREQIANGGPVTLTLPEMSRFFLSLDAAVDTLFAALAHAERGEIFVPQLDSARMADVADLLIAGRPIEKVFTGIRPGEKIHEILVSEEEAFRTTERAGHFVIQPLLPELDASSGPRPLTGEYSSADRVVAPDRLPALLGEDVLEAAPSSRP